jgi:hypothetical protein
MNPDRGQEIEALYRLSRDPAKRAAALAGANAEMRRAVEALIEAEGSATKTQTAVLSNLALTR